MGQQHRKVVKRRRRLAYLERKKGNAKARAGSRRDAPKARAKKQTAAAEELITGAAAARRTLTGCAAGLSHRRWPQRHLRVAGAAEVARTPHRASA